MRLGFLLSKLGWPPTFQIRPFCTGKTEKEDLYRQLEKLDFPTAAKILFTESPNKKKFGFDFHLVQFFFACMPSLAVYLVAQYARYEMRQMEAEVELKKKEAEEAEKLKEMDAEMTEEISSDSDLVHLKERVDALEVAVKGMVNETQKQKEKTAKQDHAEKKPETQKQQERTTKQDHAEKKPDVSRKAKSDDKLDLQNGKAAHSTPFAQENGRCYEKADDAKSTQSK